jgi:hypothetical protein
MDKRVKYFHSEHTDALIRRAYCSSDYQRSAVVAVARKLGMPTWIVYRRAVKLGCIQVIKKEPEWTQEEMELLESLAHLDPSTIAKWFKAKGYTRTPTAITVRRKRLGIGAAQARIDGGIYTSRQLGLSMGIDSHTVQAWIAKGWLKAKRAGTGRTETQGGDFWLIRQEDIKIFICEHTANVDFRKLDKFWLVDVLTGRGYGGKT